MSTQPPDLTPASGEASRRPLSYRDAGVDIDAGDRAADRYLKLMHSTFTPRVVKNDGGFAGLFNLDYDEKIFRRNYRHPMLVSSTDGVGTKLRVAFWTDRHDTVGIDLVAMSANDVLVSGAEPLFFLDYFATGKLSEGVAEQVVSGIAEGCRQARCALLGGETAEMPGHYPEGEYDLAGFIVGVVEKDDLIDGSRIEIGDLLIGLESSGLHSNGYSLARRVLFEQAGLKTDSYVGEWRRTVAEELLVPTRIYVRGVLEVMQHYEVKHILRGIAHITGGGLVENVPRILPPGCGVRLDRAHWPLPAVFATLRERGPITEREMYRTFNMGLGLVCVVPSYYADSVLRQFRKADYGAHIVGEVVAGAGEATFNPPLRDD